MKVLGLENINVRLNVTQKFANSLPLNRKHNILKEKRCQHVINLFIIITIIKINDAMSKPWRQAFSCP